jgi:hypothetical protein
LFPDVPQSLAREVHGGRAAVAPEHPMSGTEDGKECIGVGEIDVRAEAYRATRNRLHKASVNAVVAAHLVGRLVGCSLSPTSASRDRAVI